MWHSRYQMAMYLPEERRRVIDALVLAVLKLPHVDFIVGCGASGSTIGCAVAYELDLPLAIVRKDGESCHSRYHKVQGDNLMSGDYVVIDDLIDTGRTVQHIVDALDEDSDLVREEHWIMLGAPSPRPRNRPVAILLYAQHRSNLYIKDETYRVHDYEIPVVCIAP